MNRKINPLYLLGSTIRDVRKAESSLRSTYPGLQIVGRYAARYPADRENDVITAIKKSSPTLLLAGKGLKGRHLWLCRKRGDLAPGLSIFEKSCFDVFAGKKPKPDDRTGVRLTRGFFGALFHPWRFFRVFRYLLFFLLLVVERIRN